MMAKTWRDYAIEHIDTCLREYDRTSNLKKYLSENYPFGQRKYTPYKIWLEEVKIALTFEFNTQDYKGWRTRCYRIHKQQLAQEQEGQLTLF